MAGTYLSLYAKSNKRIDAKSIKHFQNIVISIGHFGNKASFETQSREVLTAHRNGARGIIIIIIHLLH